MTFLAVRKINLELAKLISKTIIKFWLVNTVSILKALLYEPPNSKVVNNLSHRGEGWLRKH